MRELCVHTQAAAQLSLLLVASLCNFSDVQQSDSSLEMPEYFVRGCGTFCRARITAHGKVFPPIPKSALDCALEKMRGKRCKDTLIGSGVAELDSPSEEKMAPHTRSQHAKAKENKRTRQKQIAARIGRPLTNARPEFVEMLKPYGWRSTSTLQATNLKRKEIWFDIYCAVSGFLTHLLTIVERVKGKAAVGHFWEQTCRPGRWNGDERGGDPRSNPSVSSTSCTTTTDPDDGGGNADTGTAAAAVAVSQTSAQFVGLTVETKCRASARRRRGKRGRTSRKNATKTTTAEFEGMSLAAVFQRVSLNFAAASLSRQCLTTVSAAQVSAVCNASVINSLCVLVAVQLQVEVGAMRFWLCLATLIGDLYSNNMV